MELVAAQALTEARLGEIQRLCGVRVRVVEVSPRAFQECFMTVYGVGAEALAQEPLPAPPATTAKPLEAGVVRFVDELLAEALRRRATDVHVEPEPEGVRVRVRVDGLLESLPVPHDLGVHVRRIASRLKVMAGLDPTPSSSPREGMIRVQGRQLRVSVLPTPVGEAVHIRVLPTPDEFLTLGDLGMPPAASEAMRRLMAARSGLVVASGPTGSGKSTTLHVVLRTLVPPCAKVITVEDPVEFILRGAVQVEVSAGLSFAQALRAVLRHDPDVILVGEMRDSTSASIALQASLTGHLVLTSLHTDDEAQAISRLVQLGMERPLLASALRGVLTQRLLRTRCSCGADPSCSSCRGSGYFGRTGIFRVVPWDGRLREAVEQGASEQEVRALIETAHGSLRRMAEELVRRGTTTQLEVVRVLGTWP